MHAFRKNNSFMLSSRNAIIHTYEIFLIFHEEKRMIKKIIAIVVIFVAAVGGVANSRHLAGCAMDFSLRGWSAERTLALVRQQKEVRYAYAIDGTHVHMDVNP